MDSGENVPDCLVKTLIETQEEEHLDWEDICMLAAVFTLGGVHSVSLDAGAIDGFLIESMNIGICPHSVASCSASLPPGDPSART
jgi:hypothetical protein